MENKSFDTQSGLGKTTIDSKTSDMKVDAKPSVSLNQDGAKLSANEQKILSKLGEVVEMLEKTGDAIERLGEKVERAGFKQVGQAIYSLGDRIEHLMDDDSSVSSTKVVSAKSSSTDSLKSSEAKH